MNCFFSNNFHKYYASQIFICHGIAHNVPRLCDVALSPTGPKGHMAEVHVAARRSPSRSEAATKHYNRCYASLRKTFSSLFIWTLYSGIVSKVKTMNNGIPNLVGFIREKQ